MLDGLLAITFRFKSNLLNNIYHTEGVFLFGESKFSRFRVRKEYEIRNWICNLGDLSQTRSIWRPFDELCDDTVLNSVIGSLNSDDRMEHNRRRRRFREETNYVEVVGSVAFVKYWQDEQFNSCKACLCGDPGLPLVPRQGGRPT